MNAAAGRTTEAEPQPESRFTVLCRNELSTQPGPRVILSVASIDGSRAHRPITVSAARGAGERSVMNPHAALWLICLLSPLQIAERPACGGEPAHRVSPANRPPRKVIVGTVIFGPYGRYAGLENRLAELSGLVDAMAS